MQGTAEQAEEMTYAGQATAQAAFVNSNSSTLTPQTFQQDPRPVDRNSQIYDYVTLVAERCHDARMSRVSEVNGPAKVAHV